MLLRDLFTLKPGTLIKGLALDDSGIDDDELSPSGRTLSAYLNVDGWRVEVSDVHFGKFVIQDKEFYYNIINHSTNFKEHPEYKNRIKSLTYQDFIDSIADKDQAKDLGELFEKYMEKHFSDDKFLSFFYDIDPVDYYPVAYRDVIGVHLGEFFFAADNFSDIPPILKVFSKMLLPTGEIRLVEMGTTDWKTKRLIVW